MKSRVTDLVFPKGFVWGASTAAHQIEGGNDRCDWWSWEQAGRSVEPSGRACDSWNRWRDDIAVAVELGLDVFRISVEWARVEPEPGRYDDGVLDHYAEVLDAVHAAGLRSMVVLWHFTNPVWLTEMGGWSNDKTPTRFAAYARVVADRLAGRVDFWATINEANTYVWRGYLDGEWPPGKVNAWLAAFGVYRRLARGHREARAALKEALGPETAVGYTHVLAWPHAAESGSALSWPMQRWWQFLANDLFMDMIHPHTDWIGVQYYYDSPARTFGLVEEDAARPRTDMGWRIVPEGLYHVVMHAWKRYRLPIYVTENGLADAADGQRERFIVDHLRWLHRAIAEGADVRGYLHWSLIDNFEWAHGFGPRFGLAEVDYDTFERRIRPSARTYAAIAARNAVAETDGQGTTYSDGTGSLGPKG